MKDDQTKNILDLINSPKVSKIFKDAIVTLNKELELNGDTDLENRLEIVLHYLLTNIKILKLNYSTLKIVEVFLSNLDNTVVDSFYVEYNEHLANKIVELKDLIRKYNEAVSNNSITKDYLKAKLKRYGIMW